MGFRTKEEADQHFHAVLKGTAVGGAAGFAVGLGCMYAAARRYPVLFRGLRLPTQAFVLTSTTSFGAIFYAERFSNKLHRHHNHAAVSSSNNSNQSASERMLEWGRENRYHIVLASWVASMAVALAAVRRSPASTSQKLVQARVYAQGLTLAVLIATAAFEVNDSHKGEGRWKTVTVVDPTDPEHKRLIEKRTHQEEYPGQDLWMSKLLLLPPIEHLAYVKTTPRNYAESS